jgi:hypothetical protein
MKSLKEYITEWWSVGTYYDFEKYHNVDNLEDKELEDAAKNEFENIKTTMSKFKRNGNVTLYIPAIIKYIGFSNKLKTDVQVMNVDVTCKTSFPKRSNYRIIAGSYKTLTTTNAEAYVIDKKDDLECKSAGSIIKKYINPIFSDFKGFCEWLKNNLKTARYYNMKTGEGIE